MSEPGTASATRQAEATVLPATEKTLASIVGRVTHAIDTILSSGDVAELRRLDPRDPCSPAFFKLMASTVDPSTDLPHSGTARDAAERRWAVIFHAAATLSGLHRPSRSLGEALQASGYSELRLVRLLRARGDQLVKEVRTCSHFLAAKAEPCDLADLARLVLVTGSDKAEAIRRRVARGYYQRNADTDKES